MANLTWTGRTGDWFTAANWDPAEVPQSGDSATITSGTAQLTSNPADGVTLALASTSPNANLLDAQNVTFGSHFTILDNTSVPVGGGLIPTNVKITGSVIDQGNISISDRGWLQLLGGASDVFTNQGNITVDSRGFFTTPVRFVNSGQIDISNSAFYIIGGMSGTGTINISNHGEVASVFPIPVSVGSGQTIDFMDGLGSLFLDPTMFKATILNFQIGDIIVSSKNIDRESYDATDHILSLFSNGQFSGSLTIAGPLNYTTASFAISNNTITTNSQLIDASGAKGPTTITGGAGPTTVWAATGDQIIGGAGALLAAGDKANNMTIAGGAGDLTAFNFGTGNSVTGSTAGTTFIDDNYGGSGNTLVGGAGSTTVISGPGDVVRGGAGAMLLNALAGTATITGGGGPTTVWGATNESIIGGSAALQVAGNAAAGETIAGGAGNLFAFNLGKNNSVVGSSSGTTFIDDNYGGGGSDTLKGGAGATTIIAGASASIIGGAGALQVGLYSTYTGDTIDLTAAGRGAASLRDNGVAGFKGSSTVTGFNASTDVIQSATSAPAGTFIGTSSSPGGNTTLTFVDGSTMTLIGVADIGGIKFTA